MLSFVLLRFTKTLFYADEHSKGNKRKERADTDTGEHTEKDYGPDLGDPKKPKLICADGLQNETLEAIPNIGEFHISISFFCN